MGKTAKIVFPVLALIILVGAVFWRQNDNAADVSFLACRNENQNTAGTAKKEAALITKVLDGDTVIIQGGEHLRLLGIDADEADYPCYQAAKSRLEELVLGRIVELEKDQQDLDQYGRKLRYIFFNGKNLNEQLVAEGLAIARFYPENQKYKQEIIDAETEAIKNKTGCKWSN